MGHGEIVGGLREMGDRVFSRCFFGRFVLRWHEEVIGERNRLHTLALRRLPAGSPGRAYFIASASLASMAGLLIAPTPLDMIMPSLLMKKLVGMAETL